MKSNRDNASSILVGATYEIIPEYLDRPYSTGTSCLITVLLILNMILDIYEKVVDLNRLSNKTEAKKELEPENDINKPTVR